MVRVKMKQLRKYIYTLPSAGKTQNQYGKDRSIQHWANNSSYLHICVQRVPATGHSYTAHKQCMWGFFSSASLLLGNHREA